MIAHSLLSESHDYLKFFVIESKSRQMAAFKCLLDCIERFSARRYFTIVYNDQDRSTSEISMEEARFLNTLFDGRVSSIPVLHVRS